MQRLGLVLVLTGFCGVPLLGLSGAGMSMRTCVELWICFGVPFFLFGVIKQGRLREYLDAELDGRLAAPMPALWTGVMFTLAAMWILVHDVPSLRKPEEQE